MDFHSGESEGEYRLKEAITSIDPTKIVVNQTLRVKIDELRMI